MSSSRIDNSGDFRSKSSQWVGNSFNANGGNIYIDASKLTSAARPFQPGLYLGDAPAIESDLFIGRSSEIKTIHEVLNPPNSVLQQQHRIILGGLGGVGKTQLAIAYARQYCSSHGSVFWLNATSESTLQTGLRHIAGLTIEAAGDLKGLDSENVLLRVHTWLASLENAKWLLVFDNYDDPKAFSISKYCPYSASGAVIVTSRVPDLVQLSSTRLRVSSLTDVEESLQILQTRSQRKGVHNDPCARRLVERLAGLPLALATAGAYLRKTTSSFDNYLQAYERRFNLNPSRPLQLNDYTDRRLDSTWNLSYSQLEQENVYAANILKLLAYFDHQNVGFELLSAGIGGSIPQWLNEVLGDHIEFENAMSTLVDYCFLETNANAASYSLHSCVHDWALNELNREVDSQLYWYAFGCVDGSIESDDWDILGHKKYAPLCQHAVRLTHSRFEACIRFDDCLLVRLNQARSIGKLLIEQSYIVAAEKILSRLSVDCTNLLGPEDFRTIMVSNECAILFNSQDKFEEAEQMYQQALTRDYNTADPERLGFLLLMKYNLAVSYTHHNRFDEAEQLCLQALAVYTKAEKLDKRQMTKVIQQLSIVYVGQGRHGDAEQMGMKALDEAEEIFGPGHISTLSSAHLLGRLYINQSKWSEAERMILRTVAGYKKAFGLGYSDTLIAVFDLGQLYYKQNRLDEAEEICLQILSELEDDTNSKNDLTLPACRILGNMYADQSRWEEMERIHRRVLVRFERLCGPDHRCTLQSKHELVVSLIFQDKIDSARLIFQQVLRERSLTLDDDDYGTLRMVDYVAHVCEDRGWYGRAEEMYLRVLKMCENTLGKEHKDTQQAREVLARFYRERDRPDQANALYDDRLEGSALS